MSTPALRVGVGGPVDSGETALTLALCQALREHYNIAVVTNDIYTEEDAQFLVRNQALGADRFIGVETGGELQPRAFGSDALRHRCCGRRDPLRRRSTRSAVQPNKSQPRCATSRWLSEFRP